VEGQSSARWPVYVALALLLLVTAAFAAAFVMTTKSEIAQAEATPQLAADSYGDRVTALLEGANAENGAALVEQYGCIVCHRLAGERIAPPFAGLSERAATRRPPLTAAAYIYQAITDPAAYMVAGYQPAMPQNYPERLSERELGDIIAYLLRPDAH
jgi:cytochrome c551/c552